MLSRLQRGLETLYRIDTKVQVLDFVIDAAARDALDVARQPREQLLLTQEDGTLQVGLFVDEDSLANLQRNDPTEVLGDHNFQDFLFAIEGVSHFVYVVWRARADRPVSALELELQAEVDKYVTCVLVSDADAALSNRLRTRLFRRIDFESDLDDEEADRYRVANANADRYSASLEQRYVSTRRIADMLAELRRFYRMSLGAKLDFIRNAA